MKIWCLIIGICMGGTAFAHGPTPQKTDESVQVSASADVVWKKIAEPCGIAKWHPEVSACDVMNDKQQTLTLKNGKKILQEVDELAAAEMRLSYRFSGEIDITALPVSSLNGRIKVAPEAGGAKITWTARYYRAFTGNEPPEGQDDESAKNAIDQFVKAGLAGLKANKSASTSKSTFTSQWNATCVAVKNFFKEMGAKLLTV